VANIDGWMMLKTALEAKLDDSCSSAMELTCLLLAEGGEEGGNGGHDLRHRLQPRALEAKPVHRSPSLSPRRHLHSEDHEETHRTSSCSETSQPRFLTSNPLCEVEPNWTPPADSDASVAAQSRVQRMSLKLASGLGAMGAAERPFLGVLDSASSDQRAAERRDAEIAQGGAGCRRPSPLRASPDQRGGRDQCVDAGHAPMDAAGHKSPFAAAVPSQWKLNALCSKEDDVDVMDVFGEDETWEFDNPDHPSGSTTPTFVGSISMDVLSNLICSGPFTWEE